MRWHLQRRCVLLELSTAYGSLLSYCHRRFHNRIIRRQCAHADHDVACKSVMVHNIGATGQLNGGVSLLGVDMRAAVASRKEKNQQIGFPPAPQCG